MFIYMLIICLRIDYCQNFSIFTRLIIHIILTFKQLLAAIISFNKIFYFSQLVGILFAVFPLIFKTSHAVSAAES